MSSYFDNAESEVAEDFERIIEVEARVKKDCLLVTGDRECPEGIKDRVVRAIALYEYDYPTDQPPTKGRQMSDISRSSFLLQKLHSIFHDLARMRIKTRFGVTLTDRPKAFLNAREEAWKKAEAREKRNRK